jgi:hypothetical protein
LIVATATGGVDDVWTTLTELDPELVMYKYPPPDMAESQGVVPTETVPVTRFDGTATTLTEFDPEFVT